MNYVHRVAQFKWHTCVMPSEKTKLNSKYQTDTLNYSSLFICSKISNNNLQQKYLKKIYLLFIDMFKINLELKIGNYISY